MSVTPTTEPVTLITSDQFTQQTTQTAGMVRQEIVARPGAWVGVNEMPANFTSGWHHHGDYETYIYVRAGQARLEFGPGGRDSLLAKAGDVFLVPRGAIHREVNPGSEPNAALVIRVGTGEPVFNVDGPEG